MDVLKVVLLVILWIITTISVKIRIETHRIDPSEPVTNQKLAIQLIIAIVATAVTITGLIR